jgi:hypothetical protein
VHRDGKPEVRHQLLESRGEAAINRMQAVAEFSGMMTGNVHESAGRQQTCVAIAPKLKYLYPSFLKGLWKENHKCRKMTVVGKH